MLHLNKEEIVPKISRRNFIKNAIALSTLPIIASANSKEDNLRFIHITDSHMDLSDENSIEAMELMVTFINEKYTNIDYVLFGGDNFNNNVKNNKDALKFKEIIDKLHCPSYLVRGNKEASTKKEKMNIDEFTKIFLETDAIHVEGKNWLLQHKGYLVLGLDSCIENQNNGLYTEKTLEFATRALRKSKPTIILNHHPYTNYWKGTKEEDIHKYVLGNTEEVQKKLFSYPNLILTLSGHKHIDSVSEINNTKAIVTRGFIRPLDLDMYPMRYVEIVENEVHEKLIYTS